MDDPVLFDLPNRLIPFYLGEATDSEGRTLRDIRAWGADRLEDVHDYIQWLFPTRQRSAFNASAPTLDDTAIRSFHSDDRLRNALLDSFQQMLGFYGFALHEVDGAPVVQLGGNWELRRRHWFFAGDHNLLRITRILDCLSTLGLETHARAFLAALDAACDAAPGTIPPRTRDFWRSATA